MRRGFTTVELTIVMPMLGLVAMATLLLFLASAGEMRTASIQADLQSDTARAAFRIFRLAPGARIDPDNRGLTCRDGARVRWEGEKLLLTPAHGPAQSLLRVPVRSFLASRRDGVLALHFELLAPLRFRGGPQPYRVSFDNPWSAP